MKVRDATSIASGLTTLLSMYLEVEKEPARRKPVSQAQSRLKIRRISGAGSYNVVTGRFCGWPPNKPSEPGG